MSDSSADYLNLVASGALKSEKPAVGSGGAVGASQPEGGNMLPFEGKTIELPNANLDDTVKSGSFDTLASPFNAGGSAFGISLTTQLGDSVNHLATKEAQGETGIKLENMGQGERQAPPTVQGDLQLKELSAKGGASQGG
mgnify:CR=1 FL=1